MSEPPRMRRRIATTISEPTRIAGHLNFGAAPELLDEDAFIERAVELARSEVGINMEAGTGPRRRSGRKIPVAHQWRIG